MSQDKTIKKILVIGPAWVGDMVMAQTLFKCISSQQVVIDVLAPSWSNPLLERMQEVRKAIIMPLGHGELNIKLRYQLGRNLRAEQYDECLILPNSFKSALIPFFAKIPKRVGWSRELRHFILTDARKLNKRKYPLMIERFMALGYAQEAILSKPYPQPRLTIKPVQVQKALDKHQLTLTDKIITVICPGAEFGPAKRWPEYHYAAVANQLLDQGGQVWLMGSPKDKEITHKIFQQTQQRCIDLAGQTSLGEAIDLMSLATQVITNDSGLMHIAAALNKPIVAIYGSSDPQFTPPLTDRIAIVRENLPCSPCFKRTCPLTHLNCLTQLKPEKVLTALIALNKDTA